LTNRPKVSALSARRESKGLGRSEDEKVLKTERIAKVQRNDKKYKTLPPRTIRYRGPKKYLVKCWDNRCMESYLGCAIISPLQVKMLSCGQPAGKLEKHGNRTKQRVRTRVNK